MGRRCTIVSSGMEAIMPGLALASGLLDCGHYAFLRDAKDTIRIGDTRLCRRCPARASAKKEGTNDG